MKVKSLQGQLVLDKINIDNNNDCLHIKNGFKLLSFKGFSKALR